MGLRFCNTTTTARDRRVAKAKGLSANDAGADCYLRCRAFDAQQLLLYHPSVKRVKRAATTYRHNIETYREPHVSPPPVRLDT